MSSSVDISFSSVYLIRALAISGIIVENYHNALWWNNVGSILDLFTSIVAAVGGTLVHIFFVLSGYGLTLSCLKKNTVCWTSWVRERFRKIIVPFWIAVAVTFIIANFSYVSAPVTGQHVYSVTTLLAYLTFLRNFYEPGWTLNPSFWFMPPIIDLYVLFPLLLLVLKRIGITGLFVFSLLAANASIAACVYFGCISDYHQGALPLYFIDEFAVGMMLAYVVYRQPHQFQRFTAPRFFLLGIVLYTLSAVISRYSVLGPGSSAYNDIFEATGLILVLLFTCRWMSETFSPGVLKFLDNMSRRSYVMYLIHWPLIVYGLKPYIWTYFGIHMGPLAMLFSSSIFVLLTFFFALCISLMIERFRLAPKPAFIAPSQ